MTDETREIVLSLLVKMKETYEDGFAQINEQLHAFRLSLRSRDRKEENPEDQICNDEELAEIEAETKSSGIEDRAVENEANATMISAIDKEEPISQFQVLVSKLEPSLQFHNASPDVCEDFKSLVGFDGLFDHVKARVVLLKKSAGVTNNQAAHYLFDKMPLRVQSKRRHIKCHKSWRFKFKHRVASRESKAGFEVNMKHNQFKEYPCLFLGSNMATLGHILYEEQPLLWMQNNSEPILIVSKLERKKKKLCYKTWMFKYKAPLKRVQFLHYYDKVVPIETNWVVQRIWDKGSPEVDIIDAYPVLQVVFEMVKELSYWFVDNHVKRDAHESFGYNLIVAFMENKKTGTKLKVKKHDNLSWKEAESRSICCILKLGGVAITCKNVLEKIYDENLEIVACRLRPAMMESSVPSKVIGRDGSKRHGRSEVSCDVDYLGDHESSSYREFVVASTDLSTVTKIIDSGFVPVLHRDAVLDNILGCTILSGDVIICHFVDHLKPECVVFFAKEASGKLEQFSGLCKELMDIDVSLDMNYETQHTKFMKKSTTGCCKQVYASFYVWLMQDSFVIQQVMRDKKIRLSKRWWFKYKCVKEGIQRLQILLRYKRRLELEEWFKIWSRGETWRKQKEIQQFTIKTEEEMEDMMKEELKQQQGDSEPLVNVPDFDAKVCETFDQYTRKKGFVRAARESENNQLTLKISMWDIQKHLDQYMVLLLTPVAYATHLSGGVGMEKKQSHHLSLRTK